MQVFGSRRGDDKALSRNDLAIPQFVGLAPDFDASPLFIAAQVCEEGLAAPDGGEWW